VLVRVIVPPQRIADGDVLKLKVIDGFIEEVNVEGLPRRLQARVLHALRPLVLRQHLLLSTIERHLLVAGNLAGLSLKSALAPGTAQGGTRLLVGGTYRQIGGTVSLDNRLDRTLGPWEIDASVALNSVLSFGEQLYADVLTSDPQRLLHASPALQVYGGGALVPIGDAGVTLNPEYTHSSTRTPATPGVPETVGVFDRIALHSSIGLRWRRRQVLKLNLTAEAINQRLETPQFGSDLYHDQYRVVRVGLNDDALSIRGTRLLADATVSRGLGGRNPPAGVPGVPLSRQGSSPDFNKLNLSMHVSQPLGSNWRLDVIGLAQESFGSPMMRSEQFSLDGIDALSAFAAGSLTVDQGVTLRTEVGRPLFNWTSRGAVVSPYLLAAAGVGELLQPTAVETRWEHASTFGAGMRATIDAPWASSAQFGFEVARQQANLPGIHNDWRANVIAGLRF
jgi:hemolysin activation/secretion protein